MSPSIHKCLSLAFLATLLSATAFAEYAPKEMAGAEIIDRIGAKLPLDVRLTNHLGETKKLSDYLLAKKPIILTLGYYQCPMLCSLVLNGLVAGLKDVGLVLGRDFELVSVSIEPKETVELARAKRANYLEVLRNTTLTPALSPEGRGRIWDFTVASEADIKRLADAVGFGFRWHEPSKQYAHAAGVFVISPDGVLSQTLWGIEFKGRDLRLALVQASQGKIGSVMDRILLSCFHYDPDSRKYGVYVMGTMRAGGALTALFLGSVLLFYWTLERKKKWTN